MSNGDSLATATRANLESNNETTAALAAQVKATIEARYIVAMQRPRDIDDVRVRILKDCQRPRFAESARYRRPVGKKKNEDTGRWEDSFVEGPSIRFAESAMRAMGNIDVNTMTVFDSREKRIIQVSATDLETNASCSKDITVSKTVERKKLKQGQKAIGERVNSYGDPVFIVEASDGEFTTKESAEVSKLMRTLVLRLIPGDIVDEAMDKCVNTVAKQDAEDPEAARKRIVDAFGAIGVSPKSLREYLGHEISMCTPPQLGELRALYQALKAGEFRWSDVVAPEEEGKEPGHGPDGIKERLRKRAAENAKKSAGKAPSKPVIDTEGEPVDDDPDGENGVAAEGEVANG